VFGVFLHIYRYLLLLKEGCFYNSHTIPVVRKTSSSTKVASKAATHRGIRLKLDCISE
jgi:hypothetical protein